MRIAIQIKQSETAVGLVGPFELNGVAAKHAGLPRADVADFAVVVVVPALAGDGVGDGFAELVRAGGRESVEVGDAAKTARAARVRHHRVKDAVVDRVVIAAGDLAGGAAALGDGDSGRQEKEIESVGRGRGQSAGGDFLLYQILDCGIVHRFPRRWSRECDSANEQAAGDRVVRDAVFGELVEELAAENEIEEFIDFR